MTSIRRSCRATTATTGPTPISKLRLRPTRPWWTRPGGPPAGRGDGALPDVPGSSLELQRRRLGRGTPRSGGSGDPLLLALLPRDAGRAASLPPVRASALRAGGRRGQLEPAARRAAEGTRRS